MHRQNRSKITSNIIKSYLSCLLKPISDCGHPWVLCNSAGNFRVVSLIAHGWWWYQWLRVPKLNINIIISGIFYIIFILYKYFYVRLYVSCIDIKMNIVQTSWRSADKSYYRDKRARVRSKFMTNQYLIYIIVSYV